MNDGAAASATMESEKPAAVSPGASVSLARRVGMFPIRVYQCTLAYVMGGHCRFTPTCSQYALDAISEHGVIKGWWMSVRRIGRCHPFCPGGHDPVPPAKK